MTTPLPLPPCRWRRTGRLFCRPFRPAPRPARACRRHAAIPAVPASPKAMNIPPHRNPERDRWGPSGSTRSTHGTLPGRNGRPPHTPSAPPPRRPLLPPSPLPPLPAPPSHPEARERPAAGFGNCSPAEAGGCPRAGRGGWCSPWSPCWLSSPRAPATPWCTGAWPPVTIPRPAWPGSLFASPTGTKAQPGQGISQDMSRVASFGGTVVAVGSQTGGDIPRAQFLISHDDGTTWQLAAVTAPGGGAPAPGHAAQLIAHGRTGWLATGPAASGPAPAASPGRWRPRPA